MLSTVTHCAVQESPQSNTLPYKSISSVFSRHTTPILEDLPEITSPTPSQSPASNSLPMQSEAEDPPDVDWNYLDRMEEEEHNDDHSPSDHPDIDCTQS